MRARPMLNRLSQINRDMFSLVIWVLFELMAEAYCRGFLCFFEIRIMQRNKTTIPLVTT